MAYPLIGGQGSVASWGTASNAYADLLAAITPASVRWSIVGETQDVTGIGALNVSRIAGLKSGSATISGFGGAAAATVTPVMGNYGSITWSGGYTANVQSWEFTARTIAVHDITSTQATPILYRYFRPDIFTSSARFTAIVDDTAAVIAPFNVGTSAATVVLTYGSAQTITMTGFPRMVEETLTKGNKQLVTYEIDGTSTVAMSGGFLSGIGTGDTWGNTVNDFPLWSAGGTVAGQLVINNISGGARKVTFADSFWTSIRASVSPGAPIGVQIGVQPTGVITIV